MTTEQFRRWQTFALRMAHRGLAIRKGKRMSRKARRYVAAEIKEFFRENFSGYGHDETLVDRIESWDNTRDKPGYSGTGVDYWDKCGPFVCDLVNSMVDGLNPNPYDSRDNDGPLARWERWDDLWGARIRCCLRAGLDLACEPSAGVLGFTAGDLRRMYRGTVPEWITEGWGKQNGEWRPVEFQAIGDGEGMWL